MNRWNLGSSIAVAGAALVTAAVFGWGMGASANNNVATKSVSHAIPHFTLSIDTPDMLDGNSTGPAFVPSNIAWPADTTIDVTIVNFDDATALPASATAYATARGIIGKMTITPLDAGNPNAAAPATQATSLDPANGVSHTFTIAGLGVNVPLAPKATTTFRFHTGGAGTYEWRCMDPCGSGDTGWGGAMDAKGYMSGSITLA
jgi:hypothetical protein